MRKLHIFDDYLIIANLIIIKAYDYEKRRRPAGL